MEPIRKIMLIRPGIRYPRQAFGQPLGLMHLASALREWLPRPPEIQILEQALLDLDAEQVAERVRSFGPDLVGFSCMTVEAEEMHRVAGLVKKDLPQVPLIIGGPHASMFHREALLDPNLELAVINQGEQTLVKVIQALESGRPLEEVRGVALRQIGEVRCTEPRDYIPDLDDLPLPAWDLVDLSLYGRQTTMNGNYYYPRWAMIMTSRGCPHRCIYCHNIFGKRTRFHGVDWVMKEIDLLVREHGVRELHIIDDLFNADLDRAKRICDEIIARNYGIKIAFPNGLRADRTDRELLEKLKRAGCYSITYGLETASPRLQKRIGKHLNMDRAREVIAWTREVGIIPQGFFMLGFPGETRQEIQATIDYAINSRLLRCWFFSVIVYPDSKLFEMAREEHPDFDFDRWDMIKQRPWGLHNFYEAATGIDMTQILRTANRRFYLRPTVIAGILWSLPKNLSLVWGMWWGLKSVSISLQKFERKLRAWLGLKSN